MLLRELLRSYSWTVIDATDSIERAVAALRGGQAFLVIADDTPTSPLTKHVRYLLSDPVGAVTPVLGFLLEGHKHETSSLMRLGRPSIVDKPLTPSKFVPGFVTLVRTWEKEPFLTLRRASYQFLSGNDAAGLKLLLKQAEFEETTSIASTALAIHLRRLGRVKQAEAILLNALKKSPRELGTMVALAELYMHAAMPKLAYRLLTGARTTYSQSMVMMPDLVQAAMLLGNVEDAIACLYLMQRAGFMEPEVSEHLSRLLFAEGREGEAERVLSNNKNALKRLQTGWAHAETQPPLTAALAPLGPTG